MDKKINYHVPDTKVLDVMSEMTFCQSGNLPNKMDDESLFYEDFS